MALSIRDSVCALCDAVISKHDEVFGTSQFIGNEMHPFFEYSDALMHRVCFRGWPQAGEFRALYNRSVPLLLRQPPRYLCENGDMVEALG